MQQADKRSSRKIDTAVANAVKVLGQDYVVVGKRRVYSWYAWLIIGTFAGIALAIVILAVRSEGFNETEAAPATSFGQDTDFRYSE